MSANPEPDPFQQLEAKLESNIKNLRIISLMAADFEDYRCNQKSLNANLLEIVDNYKAIEDITTEKVKQKSDKDIQIPLEVLNYIDRGQNPELYTRDLVIRAVNRNEHVNGQVETLSRFHSALSKKLARYFPEEMHDYQKLRAKVRQNQSQSVQNEVITNQGDSVSSKVNLEQNALELDDMMNDII